MWRKCAGRKRTVENILRFISYFSKLKFLFFPQADKITSLRIKMYRRSSMKYVNTSQYYRKDYSMFLLLQFQMNIKSTLKKKTNNNCVKWLVGEFRKQSPALYGILKECYLFVQPICKTPPCFCFLLFIDN